jgi:dTDP-4-amino-4,6-dideoxygalactose transaminase
VIDTTARRASTPTVPINDLKRWSIRHAPALRRAFDSVVQRGWYVLGPEVEAFEQEFADYCGVRHAIGVANGTDALELALRAAGIQAGDGVLTVANAGLYASIAILSAGAKPIYVDVAPDTITMSSDALRDAVGQGARAVIITHLYGRLAEVEALIAFARERRLVVIEDCAQAHGAQRNGRRAGAFGDVAAFSFYPTKNLGALGDGGAVVTSLPEIAAQVRRLRQYGWVGKYIAETAGGRNSRLDELQAAILRERLPQLDDDNRRRRAIAESYVTRAGRHSGLPPSVDHEDYVAHLFVVRRQHRDRIAALLRDDGVQTAVHYPIPDYRQRALHGVVAARALPETESACSEVLTLPCFPEMSDEEVAHVGASLDAALGRGTT